MTSEEKSKRTQSTANIYKVKSISPHQETAYDQIMFSCGF